MVANANNELKINSLDVSSAFWQGGLPKREVLQPQEDVCSSTHLWKLKCYIYGLNDAPRSWYNNVKNELGKLGGQGSAYDPALWSRKHL